ncbi:efflux RND transporter periplasmic adaptor subunit [Ectothiorhodospiraceae bacterium 2226]|nr:efflux RND transporter periplasmic adaptor subunit [Ectothiorhodospiraceae bacterium 2226]
MSDRTPPLSRAQRIGAGALLLLLALWVGLAAAQRIGDRLDPVPARERPPLAVEVVAVQSRPLSVQRHYSGSVESDVRAVISARVAGQVAEVAHREGARVRQGEPLVRLDDTELRHELARLEAVAERLAAELRHARQELTREEDLYRRDMTPERVRDEARRGVTVLEGQARENQAALAAARTRLAYTVEHAPFDAVVQTLHAQPGEFAGAGRALIELVATEPLKAVFAVPQRDAAALQAGSRVELTVPALDGTWPARVDRVYPALDAATRSATAAALFLEAPPGLRPGMAVTARVELESVDALAVPAQAVHGSAGDAWVYIVEDEVAHRRGVVTGPTRDGLTWIREGVEPGARIIVTADPRLRDGEAVRATEAR